jgi:hypothetical protein
MGKGCAGFKSLENLALDVIDLTARSRMERRDACTSMGRAERPK